MPACFTGQAAASVFVANVNTRTSAPVPTHVRQLTVRLLTAPGQSHAAWRHDSVLHTHALLFSLTSFKNQMNAMLIIVLKAISLVVAPGLGASLCNGDDCTALFRTLPVLVLANAALIVYGLVEPKRQQADGAETAGTSIAGTVTGLGGAATGEEPTPYHSIYASFAMLQADPSVLGNLGMLTACYYMPVYGCIATLLLYLRTHFAFEPHMGATLLAAIGMSATASCSVGVRIMSNTLKLAPTTIIKIGLSSLFLAQVGMGVGSMLGQFYFAALLFGVGFTVMPSVNALVAERASPQQQGTAQGAMHGIKALTEGVGPLVYAILFRIFDGKPLACIKTKKKSYVQDV